MVSELDIKPNETTRDLAKTGLSEDRCLSTPPSVETLQEKSENLLSAVQGMQYPDTTATIFCSNMACPSIGYTESIPCFTAKRVLIGDYEKAELEKELLASFY